MPLRSFAHSVALIKIHIVFVTKYRHPVISGNIEEDIKDLAQSICEKNTTGHASCPLKHGQKYTWRVKSKYNANTIMQMHLNGGDKCLGVPFAFLYCLYYMHFRSIFCK